MTKKMDRCSQCNNGILVHYFIGCPDNECEGKLCCMCHSVTDVCFLCKKTFNKNSVFTKTAHFQRNDLPHFCKLTKFDVEKNNLKYNSLVNLEIKDDFSRSECLKMQIIYEILLTKSIDSLTGTFLIFQLISIVENEKVNQALLENVFVKLKPKYKSYDILARNMCQANITKNMVIRSKKLMEKAQPESKTLLISICEAYEISLEEKNMEKKKINHQKRITKKDTIFGGIFAIFLMFMIFSLYIKGGNCSVNWKVKTIHDRHQITIIDYELKENNSKVTWKKFLPIYRECKEMHGKICKCPKQTWKEHFPYYINCTGQICKCPKNAWKKYFPNYKECFGENAEVCNCPRNFKEIKGSQKHNFNCTCPDSVKQFHNQFKSLKTTQSKLIGCNEMIKKDSFTAITIDPYLNCDKISQYLIYKGFKNYKVTSKQSLSNITAKKKSVMKEYTYFVNDILSHSYFTLYDYKRAIKLLLTGYEEYKAEIGKLSRSFFDERASCNIHVCFSKTWEIEYYSIIRLEKYRMIFIDPKSNNSLQTIKIENSTISIFYLNNERHHLNCSRNKTLTCKGRCLLIYSCKPNIVKLITLQKYNLYYMIYLYILWTVVSFTIVVIKYSPTNYSQLLDKNIYM